MSTQTCEKCGGVYIDPQADGSRYVHVCPPARAVAPERKGLLRRLWERLRKA